MGKSIAKILMYLTGTYALLGYAFLSIWFIGILLNLVLGEISFLPALLQNTISLIEALMNSGFLGFIVALIFVGQFFFAYHAHNVFNRLSKIDTTYSTKEREEYITYIILVILFLIYLL
jgi:hypothetical protein